MDDLTPEQRRKNMQAIKSKDTAIELAMRKHYGMRESGTEKTIKICQENQT